MFKAISIFLIALISCSTILGQSEECKASLNPYACHICNGNHGKHKSNGINTPLLERPIQENYVFTNTRRETIKLRLAPNTEIDRVTGVATYEIGQGRPSLKTYELEFNDKGIDGDEVAGDGIYTAHEQLVLLHEVWIPTYRIFSVPLRLKFYNGGTEVHSDNVTPNTILTYVHFNKDFFRSIPDPLVNDISGDGAVVHVGNAVYLDYQKLYDEYSDRSLDFATTPFDMVINIESYLNMLWDEFIVVDIREAPLGLRDLGSYVYSISLTGLSGNTHHWWRKAGQTSMFALLNTCTLNHELFHHYQPLFFEHSLNHNQSPIYNRGKSGSHMPALFTGQSGFEVRGPISSSGFSLFCPEDIERIKINSSKQILTSDSRCESSSLAMIDGLAQGIHSRFELFMMKLLEVDDLDLPMYIGFNPKRISPPHQWTTEHSFDNLTKLDRDDLIKMRNDWYTRDNGIYKYHYNSENPNALFFFNGSGKRSFEEYKMMSFISDELTRKESQQSIPRFAQYGEYNAYRRYLSYNQATQGLGTLTNNFPLPKNFISTSTQDINDDQITIYPNPSTTHFYIKGLEYTGNVQIRDISGKLISNHQNTNKVALDGLSTGVYIVQIQAKNKVFTQKLIKL